jgi:nitronate monooxygenase
LANNNAQKCQELESRGASLEELMTVIAGKIGKACYESGDVEGGMFPVGPAVGLITQIKSVREIMDEIMDEAEAALALLNGLSAN